MAGFSRTLQRLDGTALGVVGAGRLGGTLIKGLLDAGFPRARLLVAHGRSAETRARLAKTGLSDRIVDTQSLVRGSGIIFLVVPPQSVSALQGAADSPGRLVISFAAAVPLAKLPWLGVTGTGVRVLTSAPETIERRDAIAAVTPPGDPVVLELLGALGLSPVPVDEEDDLHAFTAAGVCLPMAFAFLRGRGQEPKDEEIRAFAARHRLPHLEAVLEWAHHAEPAFKDENERHMFIRNGTTPGGVTEAMLRAIEAGGTLLHALEAGLRRSRELGGQ
jgi:pyrroline-5-carboxylate reductase